MKLVKHLVFLSILLLPLTAMAALLGGWHEIKDVKDPHVVEIAKYAVSEYNKQSKAGLIYKRVVSGQEQVVAGMNYKLVILAKVGNGGSSKKYEAVVYEKAGKEQSKSLTSFKPVDGKVHQTHE